MTRTLTYKPLLLVLLFGIILHFVNAAYENVDDDAELLVLDSEIVKFALEKADTPVELQDECRASGTAWFECNQAGATWFKLEGSADKNLFITICAPDIIKYYDTCTVWSFFSPDVGNNSDRALVRRNTTSIRRDRCGSLHFASVSNGVYYLAVLGRIAYSSEYVPLGSTNMEITIESRERPSNDICEGAMDIQLTDGQDEIVMAGTLKNSTAEWPELAIDYGSNIGLPCRTVVGASEMDSVWYKLTGVSGGIRVSTSGDPNTYYRYGRDSMPLNIHVGLECDSLKCIGQATYWRIPDQASMKSSQYFYWVAKKEETYFIEVTSSLFTEDFNLTIRREEAAENDNCNGAVPLADMRGKSDEEVSGLREYVTKESNLPTNKCGFLLYPGVWYSVQGTGNNLKVDSALYGNSLVSVFKGNCEALQCMGGTTRLDFTWASNYDETYYLLAHGGNGEYAFNITDLQPPNNDQCKEAISLDTGVMHHISTVNASQNEFGLPEHCGSAFVWNNDYGRSPGVWYKVTASNDSSHNALVALTNSSESSLITISPELVVYSGNCDSLTCLNSGIVKFDDPLVWLVNPGETYFVYAADVRTEEHSLLIEPTVPVSNDRCAGAIPLRVGDTVRGYTQNATLDIDMPDCQEEFPSAGVWYKLVVGPNDIVRRLRIATGTTPSLSPLAIFSGSCQQLDCVDSSSLNGPTGYYYSLSVEAGKTYYIMVVMLKSTSHFDLRVELDFDPAPVGTVCFPGEALVETLDSGMVAMQNLEIGDMVDTGLSGFARVYGFGHKKDSSSHAVNYVHIEASDAGISLMISPNHLLFVNKHFVPASTVVIGDNILVGEDGNAGQVVTATISKVTLVVRRGAYAPFTTTGTIMVNNVLVSNYVTLQSGVGTLQLGGIQTPLSMHWLAHLSQAPHRMFDKWHNGTQAGETYNEDGVSSWVDTSLQASRWLLRQHWLVQWMMFLPILLLLLVMGAIESILMVSLTAKATTATLILILYCATNNLRGVTTITKALKKT